MAEVVSHQLALTPLNVADVVVRTEWVVMQSSDASLQDVLEAMPDAVIGVGIQGRILLVNERAEQVFHFRRDELIGQYLELLIPSSLRGAHAKHFASYVANPHPRPMGSIELQGRRSDGSEFPAEISLRSFHLRGEAIMLAAIRDISDRVRDNSEREQFRVAAARHDLEERLHQAERLESLGLLAGGVAHDVNNMVGAILNYASFISSAAIPFLDGPDGEAWAQVQHDASQVERAAQRAAELTHQLLVFGRRDVAQPEVIDLNLVVRTVAAFLPRTIGEQVEVRTNLASALPTIFADPGQLERVLVNLAINARDAMPRGGVLVFATESVEFSANDAPPTVGLSPGHFVRLTVADDGSGMDSETLARAFEPFFTTKPPGEGTGLGLSMVYGIVTQAGGSIRMDSELGSGSTLSMWFPASHQEAKPGIASEEPAHHRNGGETVLIVEDDDALREVAQRILTDTGYQVLVASDGATAIELASAHGVHVDLLVTDVVMPKMMGKAVAERVKAIFPEIRVLFMSGYAYPVLTSQGVLDANVILIEKPFTATSLLDRVQSALGHAAT